MINSRVPDKCPIKAEQAKKMTDFVSRVIIFHTFVPEFADMIRWRAMSTGE
ncbi:MAG: hypothetical protein LBP56_01230 [Odoribacteraceae bacterium]|jgi:hypothetical protein|nr:hypothetical protein [Odoribacteraceae bacterium]